MLKAALAAPAPQVLAALTSMPRNTLLLDSTHWRKMVECLTAGGEWDAVLALVRPGWFGLRLDRAGERQMAVCA